MVSNSRTKLRMKLLNVEKRDNIEFYLCCKFQCSPFSVHCKTDVTDGMTNELPYAVAPPLGIINMMAPSAFSSGGVVARSVPLSSQVGRDDLSIWPRGGHLKFLSAVLSLPRAAQRSGNVYFKGVQRLHVNT